LSSGAAALTVGMISAILLMARRRAVTSCSASGLTRSVLFSRICQRAPARVTGGGGTVREAAGEGGRRLVKLIQQGGPASGRAGPPRDGRAPCPQRPPAPPPRSPRPRASPADPTRRAAPRAPQSVCTCTVRASRVLRLAQNDHSPKPRPTWGLGDDIQTPRRWLACLAGATAGARVGGTDLVEVREGRVVSD